MSRRMKPDVRPYLDQIMIIVLLAVCYALFFHQLGGLGLVGPDEPRYAAIAREMLMTGDYVTPRLHGVPWFEKPPLMYWLAAASYRIMGVNEASARLPSAAAAALCVFLVYWCGRRLWDRWMGFFAAIVLATSIGWFTFARAASMDMLLTASLTMALVFVLVGFNTDGSGGRVWFYLFYASLALGVLAKGPVALVLPAISLAAFRLTRGRLEPRKSWHPEGLLITAVIAAPWFVMCTLANGSEFINVFLINHNVQRFALEIHGHQRPLYFYFPVLLLLTFPWTFFLFSALRRPFGKTERILAWWAIVPFVFFSLAGSKLPGYILPIVPPIALLCAKEIWHAHSGSFRAAVFIEAGTMAFIGVAFGFFGSMLNVDAHVSGMLIAGITFGIAAVLCVIALLSKTAFLFGFNAAVMIIAVLAATTMVFPRFERTDTMRPWNYALNQIVPKDQTVVMYKPARWVEYSLQFYRFNLARGVFTAEEFAAAVAAAERVLCIAEDKKLEELSHVANVDMEVVQSIGNHTAFWAWRVNK